MQNPSHPLTLLVLATLPGLSAFPQEGDRSGELDTAPGYVELLAEPVRIPFRGNGPRPIPIVTAMLNGQGPFDFYFDTGASVCVLDRGLARKLGLDLSEKATIGDSTANARLDAERTRAEVLELEGMLFEDVPFITMDRSRLGAQYGVMGVLGLPLFEKHLLSLDYKASWLEVIDARLPAEGPHIVPCKMDPLPEVKIDLVGVEAIALFDSGAPTSIALPESATKHLSFLREPSVMGMARTVNSEFRILAAQVEGTFLLAGNRFEDPEIQINDQLPRVNVGYEIMKDFVLTIDQREQRIRFAPTPWAPVEASADPADKGEAR